MLSPEKRAVLPDQKEKEAVVVVEQEEEREAMLVDDRHAVGAAEEQQEEDAMEEDDKPVTPSPTWYAFSPWEPWSPWLSRAPGAYAGPTVPQATEPEWQPGTPDSVLADDVPGTPPPKAESDDEEE